MQFPLFDVFKTKHNKALRENLVWPFIGQQVELEIPIYPLQPELLSGIRVLFMQDLWGPGFKLHGHLAWVSSAVYALWKDQLLHRLLSSFPPCLIDAIFLPAWVYLGFLTSGSEFDCAFPKGCSAQTHLVPEIKILVAGFIVTNLPKKSDLYVITGQWNEAVSG